MPGLLSSTVSPSIVSSRANPDQSQEGGDFFALFYPSDIGSILSLYIKTQAGKPKQYTVGLPAASFPGP